MEFEFGWLVFLLMVFPCELVRNVNIYDVPPDELVQDNILSSDIRPIRYELTISSDLEDLTPFYEGNVRIKIHCEKSTWFLTLHQVDFILVKDDIQVQSLKKDGEPTGYFVTITNEGPLKGNPLQLNLRTPLVKNNLYEVTIKFFTKNMFTFHQAGYILRDYAKGNRQVTKYMAFTKIDEFDARRIFPNFDQINMKAKFKMWLEHPKKFTAFASARYKTNHQIPTRPDWIKDEFYETENMSSFSLALALAEFQSTGFHHPLNVKVQTWGTRTTASRVNHINRMASRIFVFFSDLFKLPHPLGKLDILILPQVDFQFRESFGIIYMSDTYALDIVEKNSTPATLDMLTKICHAVSYQWLGNTVTMSKWQDSWWLQGLNSFLQTECLENVFTEYPANLLQLNLVESFTTFLRNEEIHEYERISILKSYPDYHPLNNLTEERLLHFIRMVYFILGPKAFNRRLVNYVDEYQHNNSPLDKAIAAFSDRPDSDEPKILPPNFTIKKIMDSWIDDRETPLLRVEINRVAKIATVTQEIFDSLDVNAQNTALKDNCWMIPLSFTTKKEMEFKRITPRIWSWCESVRFSTGDLEERDWVLVNLELNVPGRVMYEPENWIFIQESLLDPVEYEKISVLTRVRILSDMFSLAEAGILSYEIVFKTVAYLKHEPEYVVWNVFFKQIDHLRLLLLRTDLFQMFQIFVRTILEPVYKNRVFKYLEKVPRGKEVESHFEVSLMEFSCKFGVTGCNIKCSSLFKLWLATHGLGKQLNMRHSIYKIVLCERIKDGNEEFFDDFWKSSLEMKLPGSKDDLLEAFACSKKNETLKKLLNESINSKIISPEESISIFRFLSSNENGYKMMMKFYLKKYDKIRKFHSGTGTSDLSYFEILLDATNNAKDQTTLSNFAIKEGLVLSGNATWRSMKNAIRNADWAKKNIEALTKVLRDMKLPAPSAEE